MIREYFWKFFRNFSNLKKNEFRRWAFPIRTASVAPVAKKAIVFNEKITTFRLLPDQTQSWHVVH